ncbi:MAG: GIY-YIG nuclease family protein [Gammaproteobacteria bacterium]|nr:GIY-YIG nuclease family protein [Gammaproteobacteria bacterium]MCK5667902.1 GIY-YIG nuclease family protein [Gammaproteobacteria bacterium]
MSAWFVYMVRCGDNSLYTGIAKDVERRIHEHNNDDTLGAKYTKARRPVALVYQEACESRSTATRREYEIKLLSRLEKEELFSRS